MDPEEFEALPDQSDLKVELRPEQVAPSPPRWMNAEQRDALLSEGSCGRRPLLCRGSGMRRRTLNGPGDAGQCHALFFPMDP